METTGKPQTLTPKPLKGRRLRVGGLQQGQWWLISE